MGVAPNPLRSRKMSDLKFSTHAQFRMEGGEVDQNLIRDLMAAPKADYDIDTHSGNYVFRAKDYRIVMKKNNDGSFVVISIFNKDQFPI
jgi:hypothetical protein